MIELEERIYQAKRNLRNIYHDFFEMRGFYIQQADDLRWIYSKDGVFFDDPEKVMAVICDELESN